MTYERHPHNFWKNRGYTEIPHLKATFNWQDLDETSASPKNLTFWVKKHK